MVQQNVKQHIQSRFAHVAANYRSSAVHAVGVDLDLMVKESPMTPDCVVLDAGCGAGHTAMAFAPHVRRVIACDFTQSMLDQVAALANERAIANVVTQLADVEQLPFPDKRLDIVASRYSAHHWLYPERALAEFRRVLKSGGVFVISDIMAQDDYAQDTFLQCFELLRDPSHVRDYRISEWLRMMESAGFQTEVLHRFDLKLHFATWTKRMATPAANANMIKTLFGTASIDIKHAFKIPDRINSDDFDFYIPGAVLKAVARP